VNPLEITYVVASVLVTGVLAYLSGRVGFKGEVVALGKASAADATARDEYRKVLRHQMQASFWVMLGAGIAAVAILTLALVFTLLEINTATATKVVGTVSGIGDCALFGFLRSVWADCAKRYKEEFPAGANANSGGSAT
jgi:hypothetical protein